MYFCILPYFLCFLFNFNNHLQIKEIYFYLPFISYSFAHETLILNPKSLYKRDLYMKNILIHLSKKNMKLRF